MCAGIYAIKIDSTIVYIGKSKNILERFAQHFVGITKGKEPKYKVLKEAKHRGHNINAIMLYCAASSGDALIEELGQKEGEYIRLYRPVLNAQIPKAENWRSYERQ